MSTAVNTVEVIQVVYPECIISQYSNKEDLLQMHIHAVWKTYLTDSVSTKVCCRPPVINFGKAVNRPSMRAFVISTNCRDTRAKVT